MNVVSFPREVKVSDIAAMARKFADDLEAGEYGDCLSALVIVNTDNDMHLFNWGEAFSYHESVGVLEFAKGHVIREVLGD